MVLPPASLFLTTLLACVAGSTASHFADPPRTEPSDKGTKPQDDSPGASPVDDAARAAIKAVPRRKKVGRIRGLRLKAAVSFASAPGDPHELAVSYAFPARCRVVLSGQNGRNERFRLGDVFFGRNVQAGGAPIGAESYQISGDGKKETQLDMALREATFLWPDGIPFEGRGTTFTAKVQDIGILMATVDEATGRPTHIRAFGEDGKVAAEFRDIQWSEPVEGKRAWPASLTFAAGGQVVWTETIHSIEDEWLFTDSWFLPADRLTAVMGKRAKGALRVRALNGAWTFAAPIAEVDGRPADLPQALRQAAKGWDEFRRELPNLFAEAAAPLALPSISVVLGPGLRPIRIEYEAQAKSSPLETSDGSADQSIWRGPTNVWVRLCDSAASVTEEALEELRQAAPEALHGPSSNVAPRVRFRLGEERIGDKIRPLAMDLRLLLNAPIPREAAPTEDR